MSLLVAMHAIDGSVLAEDTRCIATVGGMNYQQDNVSKVRRLGPNCVVGVTGRIELMSDFLEAAQKAGITFSDTEKPRETIDKLTSFMRSSYEKQYGECNWNEEIITTLTLIGQTGHSPKPFIHRMVLNGMKFAPTPHSTYVISGQDGHGGCYYISRFWHAAMTVEQAAYLAYFTICEVAAKDGAVGIPVEVFIVRNGVANPISEELAAEFRLRHESNFEQMQSWLSSSLN